MSRMTISCAVLVSLCGHGLVSVTAKAQEHLDAEAYGQQLIDAGNNTIELLLTKFQPHFPKAKRYLLSSDRVGVQVAADFNAFADFRNEEVIIPAQIVSETFAEVQAFIYMQNRPSSRRHFDRWMRYLTERSRRAFQRFKDGESGIDDIPVRPLWDYAGLPAPANLDAHDENLQQEMMIDVIGLIVAHELGHLVLDHQNYKDISASESRRQEYAADDFAARLMVASGRSVLPGVMTSYSRFAYTEEMFNSYDDETSTHPPGPCRVYRLLEAHLRLDPPDDRDRANFEAGGMKFGELEALIASTKEQCGD